MSTPKQMIDAQRSAFDAHFIVWGYFLPDLLTPDALAALLKDNEEQARLLGMSAERECALRGEVKRLGRDLAAARAEIDQWAARCAAAIWMIPETITGGELNEAQNKFHNKVANLKRELAAARAEVEATNKYCDILKDSNDRACAEVEKLRDALKTALAIESLDEENLQELIVRCRKIINKKL